MLKLSKMTDYAVIVLAEMAKQEEGALTSASALATATSLPEPTVSKILKMLVRCDIVQSVRGAQGGYSLQTKPQNISIAHVIAATDGPITMTSCVSHSADCCDRTHSCSMKGKWNDVNAAMVKTLEGITLQQMIGGRS